MKFRTSADFNKDPKDILAIMEDIMNEMRNDMGTGKVKQWNLLKFFINDLDEKTR